MNKIKPFNWAQLILLFGVPTILNFIACKIAIPFYDSRSSIPIELTYFLSVGILVLVPMFFGAIFLSIIEIKSNRLVDLFNRMRIKKLTRLDVIWTIGGFILLSFLSFIIAKIILPRFGIDASPFFFKDMPLSKEYFRILYIWPLFFFFNIFGEEFLWRGYIQPRQELLNNKYTWLAHGILWAIWHLPMGLDLIFPPCRYFLSCPALFKSGRTQLLQS